jgi:hypothetical protein
MWRLDDRLFSEIFERSENDINVQYLVQIKDDIKATKTYYSYVEEPKASQ